METAAGNRGPDAVLRWQPRRFREYWTKLLEMSFEVSAMKTEHGRRGSTNSISREPG
jgi:hypothetical protein